VKKRRQQARGGLNAAEEFMAKTGYSQAHAYRLLQQQKAAREAPGRGSLRAWLQPNPSLSEEVRGELEEGADGVSDDDDGDDGDDDQWWVDFGEEAVVGDGMPADESKGPTRRERRLQARNERQGRAAQAAENLQKMVDSPSWKGLRARDHYLIFQLLAYLRLVAEGESCGAAATKVAAVDRYGRKLLLCLQFRLMMSRQCSC
jgi:hypothetical protein